MKNIIVSILFMLPIMSFCQDTFNVFCLNSNLQLIEESNNGIYNKTISDSAIKLIVGAMEFEDSKEDLDGNELLSERRSYFNLFATLDTSIVYDEISKTVLDKKKRTGEITATLGKYLCEIDSIKNWIFFKNETIMADSLVQDGILFYQLVSDVRKNEYTKDYFLTTFGQIIKGLLKNE